MKNNRQKSFLICGPLPPPNYGPSSVYGQLKGLNLWNNCKMTFMNIRFFQFKKNSIQKILQLPKLSYYLTRYVGYLLFKRPEFIIYSVNFDDRLPFYKDFFFVVIARIFSKKIIQYDMGQYAIEFWERISSFEKRLFCFIINSFHLIIVQGEQTRKRYSYVIDVDKIQSLPCCAVDTSNIEIDTTIYYDLEKINILYFSLLSESKGLWIAMKSAEMLSKKFPNLHFNFVGAGDSDNTLNDFNDFVLKNGLVDNIIYHGYAATEQEKILHFRYNDIFIFPTNRDTFGIVLLHAMAEAKPVISTIEGNIPDIIKHNFNGFLFNKNDHQQLAEYLQVLIEDESLRKEFGIRSRDIFLENYTAEKYSDNLKKILTL